MSDALAALRELVACADEADQIYVVQLYGKPHTPEHKARVLDHRQRRSEAWREARRIVAEADTGGSSHEQG